MKKAKSSIGIYPIQAVCAASIGFLLSGFGLGLPRGNRIINNIAAKPQQQHKYCAIGQFIQWGTTL